MQGGEEKNDSALYGKKGRYDPTPVKEEEQMCSPEGQNF